MYFDGDACATRADGVLIVVMRQGSIDEVKWRVVVKTLGQIHTYSTRGLPQWFQDLCCDLRAPEAAVQD